MALEDKIDEAGKSIENIKGSPIKIEDLILTDLQIAKKMLMKNLASSTSTKENPDIKSFNSEEDIEEDAHLIIYGKLMLQTEGDYPNKYPAPGGNLSNIYVDNEVKYPECVDKQNGLPKDHPQKEWIKDTIKKIKDAILQLGVKILDLGKEIISCMFQIVHLLLH